MDGEPIAADESTGADSRSADESADAQPVGDAANDQLAEAEASSMAMEGAAEAAAASDAAITTQASTATTQAAGSYDYDATLYADMTGVYETAIDPNSATAKDALTVGIPSIADSNLKDEPTTESPAIIQGAAVGYEEKTGAVEYKKIKDRPEPLSDFTVSVVEEKSQDGSVHKKVTGYDGTYVIMRLDVSSFFSGRDVTKSYLHVKQEDNNVLLAAIGMLDNNKAFSSLAKKTGSYLLKDLLDATGGNTTTPFLDIIMFATASNVAGADSGKANALTGDIPLSIYVDEVFDYNPTLKYNPQSTDPQHAEKCLAKFFDATKVMASEISHYLLKGSDLALEVMVEDSGGPNKDTGTTYWSLKKAMEKTYYDQKVDESPADSGCGRTVKLMSEVAIVNGLDLHGTDANHLKKRTLDVNSFDIQVANNTTKGKNTYSDGIDLKNYWMELMDSSNTTGAELAIGDNAKFTIGSGGKLIIDETCQLEVEWDGATVLPGQKADILNNGMLNLLPGGEIQNDGIITIEGTEGKPVQAGAAGEQAKSAFKGQGVLTISKGATLTNNGCLLVNGTLINLGTLINNGKYSDVIMSYDPDNGQFAYHKGIQVSWKDDVTQPGVVPGTLYNGRDLQGNVVAQALLNNLGDILLFPGRLVNYGTLVNAAGAHIYTATATEAIIPIEPDPKNPLIQTKRVNLSNWESGVIENYGTIINDGEIVPCSVVINDNGSFGALSVYGEHPELFGFPKSNNHGVVMNNGYIYGWGDGQIGTQMADVVAQEGTLPKTGDSAEGVFAALVAMIGSLGTMLFVKRRQPKHAKAALR